MAAETVGRADYQLGTDLSGLKTGMKEADALVKESGERTEETYKSAGYRAGELLGHGIKTGLKIVGGAAAAAFGIATKGVIELENVTADFRAETGATAAEADRAGDAINRMAGKNIQPIKEIGATMGKVVTQLGLTGKAAEDTTQTFLTFARATKQDAAGAVSAFDDILDGFNLEASESKKIMDALVVSQQKYGGSVQENQAALAQMAPQLRALNMTWEDGISLLNLYADAGIDAAGGQMALNTAIQKLPPGTSLEDFIKKLASIEDPGERATAAVEIFGSRAGAKMANAIKPGMDSLDDYAISAQEAAGATKQAADVLDDTFTSKITLKIKEVSSALTGVAKEFGPVLTGFASLATLGASLGLDTLLKNFGPKFVEIMKGAGRQGGEALADGMQAVWSGAQGTVLGNFIASRIEIGLDPAKNSRLAQAAKRGAAKVGVMWAAGFAAAGVIADSVSGVITKLPGMGKVRAAVLSAGMASGTAYGTAFGIAAKVAVVGIAATMADALSEPINKAGKDVHEMLFANDGPFGGLGDALEGIGRWQQDLSWPFGPKGAPDWAAGKRATEEGLKTVVEDPLTQTEKIVRARGIETGLAATRAVGTGITQGVSEVKAAWQAGPQAYLHATGEQAKEAGHRWGNLAAGGVAAGIVEARAKPKDAWDTMLEMIKNSMTPAKERSNLLGKLVSEELVKGLKSKDPAVRAQAQFTKQTIIDRLMELKSQTGPLSEKAAAAVAKGLKSKDADVRRAAQAVRDAAKKPIKQAADATRAYGVATGRNYANGIWATTQAVRDAARALSLPVQKYLQLLSPAKEGPLSEHGGPEGWGSRLSVLYAGGIMKSSGRIREAARMAAEASRLTGSAGATSVANGLAVMNDIQRVSGGLPGARRADAAWSGDLNIQVSVDRLDGSDPRSIRELAQQLGEEVRLTLTRGNGLFALDGS
jgi:hypothetical protein